MFDLKQAFETNILRPNEFLIQFLIESVRMRKELLKRTKKADLLARDDLYVA